MKILDDIVNNLSLVKRESPLIHHITNFVTVNDCANIVLALGGSPVMTDDIREVEDMVSISSALVLNIGAVDPHISEAMLLACKKANEVGIPVVLDPVGVGSTTFRTDFTQKILDEMKVSVICGNMSEIKVLAGVKTQVKGVDSTDTTIGGEEIAEKLALKLGCIVAATGKKDIITSGGETYIIENGHEMMSRVTGTGCMCTSLIGTYSAVSNNLLQSAIAGVLTMGLAGEKSFHSLKKNEGTGTFRVRLIDNVSNLTGEEILQNAKVYKFR